MKSSHVLRPVVVTGLLLLLALAPAAWAQDAQATSPQTSTDQGNVQRLQAIEVLGSRIKRAEVVGQTPVLTITAKDIQQSGLASIGDVIQQLSVSGSSLNTKRSEERRVGKECRCRWSQCQ